MANCLQIVCKCLVYIRGITLNLYDRKKLAPSCRFLSNLFRFRGWRKFSISRWRGDARDVKHDVQFDVESCLGVQFTIILSCCLIPPFALSWITTSKIILYMLYHYQINFILQWIIFIDMIIMEKLPINRKIRVRDSKNCIATFSDKNYLLEGFYRINVVLWKHL